MHVYRKLEYLLKNEITELYLMSALRKFALSTIEVFVPIFLLQIGFSLLEVGVYVALHYFFAIIFCYVALKVASKKGIHHILIYSVPLTIFLFLGLYNIELLVNVLGKYATLTLIAFLYSISGAMYWMGFHIEFAKFSDEKKGMAQIGTMNIISTIMGVFGPLIGGVIITLTSFNVLFICVIFILFISIIPLSFSKEYHESFEFNLSYAFAKSENSKHLPFLGEGIRDVATRILWPVFMFVIALSISKIGFMVTLSYAVYIIFLYFLGHKTKDINKFKILNVGIWFDSIVLLLRAVIRSVFVIGIAQTLAGFAAALVRIPFQGIFYSNSKKLGVANFVYLREIYLNLGRIIAAAVLVLIAVLTNDIIALQSVMIFGAFAVFLMGFIQDEKFKA